MILAQSCERLAVGSSSDPYLRVTRIRKSTARKRYAGDPTSGGLPVSTREVDYSAEQRGRSALGKETGAPGLTRRDLNSAMALMRERGLRVSAARRLVLEALLAADGPMSAEQMADGVGGRGASS